MSYEDKTLTCTECGQAFTFTADDQQYHADKGYMNEPKRCTSCRQARPSAAPRAAKRGATDPAAAASGTTAVPARCIPWSAPNAARTHRCRFSPEATARFTVATATADKAEEAPHHADTRLA